MLGYTETYGLVFLFVLLRILAIVMVLPLWSGQIPGDFRMAAAIWLSILFSFVVTPTSLPQNITAAGVVMGGALEFFTGALLGFFMRVILAASSPDFRWASLSPT